MASKSKVANLSPAAPADFGSLGPATAKREHNLEMPLAAYQRWADALTAGFDAKATLRAAMGEAARALPGVDYVPLDTSMQFDRALTEYLANRRGR